MKPSIRLPVSTSAIRHLWSSPWTRWIGLRYLKSKKSSQFLSFITVLSIAGVMVGVTAMIVVLSVMDGFEVELKKRLMATDLHILITPTREVPDFDKGLVPLQGFQGGDADRYIHLQPQVKGAWPILATEAILRTGRKVTGALIKGITDEKMEELKTQVRQVAEPQMLLQGKGVNKKRLPGIFIGEEMSLMMGLIPGDAVTLISPTETQGPLQAVPRLKKFVVEGVYRSGLPDQELHEVFTPVKNVYSYLRKKDVVSQWEISTRDFEKAPAIANEIRKRAPGYRVQDWIQLNSSLFASLKLERVAMFVVLAFIIIVASFNIVTTLTLMVLEKRREISILKAMGARHGQVGAIFLAEGVLIGTIGVSLGVVLAAILCFLLQRYEFIQLPDIYYDRTLPVTNNPMYFILVAVSALLIVLAACLYPSKRAAKLHPIEGIRVG